MKWVNFENETAGCPLLLNSRAKVRQKEGGQPKLQILQMLVKPLQMPQGENTNAPREKNKCPKGKIKIPRLGCSPSRRGLKKRHSKRRPFPQQASPVPTASVGRSHSKENSPPPWEEGHLLHRKSCCHRGRRVTSSLPRYCALITNSLSFRRTFVGRGMLMCHPCWAVCTGLRS